MKKTFLGLITIFFISIGCTAKGINKMEFKHLFQSTCISRYQMDLPSDSYYTVARYKDSLVKVVISDPSLKKAKKIGFYDGIERKKDWANRIEKKRSERFNEPKYFNKLFSDDLSILSYFIRFHPGKPGDGYIFKTFGLKNFLNMAVEIDAKTVEFDYSDQRYREKYAEHLERYKQRANQMAYQPWPHNQLGICLNNQLLLNTEKALDDEYFQITYTNGKETKFTFEFIAFPKQHWQSLDKKMGYSAGLVSLFASEHLTVGGRAGRLFVSPGRYDDSILEYKWVASDAKAGSTRLPYMRISGSVNVADFPELVAVGITNEDLLVILLRSMRVRENGMLGTQ
ncbi:hypothetical protein [Pelagibaculum spongiae]|uniref:Tle cognate immunity protein 4 C-terminal domain-containing protein n=1 Tax=Pelagibaculum spongiae TaxID=2080658 RepID=A0A2V1H000_9GAMM|nr:hypothetical protein [Pelagibaculum spongiae]PVZ68921.1 hypothetical protein DC094_11765 [Pelagibaculum spongiae]